MRTLKLHFSDDALPTLDTFLKRTKEARIFRRAQAVHEVVKGQRIQNVSDGLQFTYSALRKWVVAPHLTVVTSTSAQSGVAVPVQDALAAAVVPSATAVHETTGVRASSSNGR